MRSELLYTAALASCTGIAGAAWNHNDYLYSPTPDEIPNR